MTSDEVSLPEKYICRVAILVEHAADDQNGNAWHACVDQAGALRRAGAVKGSFLIGLCSNFNVAMARGLAGIEEYGPEAHLSDENSRALAGGNHVSPLLLDRRRDACAEPGRRLWAGST